MEYLLTKQEFENLVPKEEIERRDRALNTAREKLLEIARFDCVHDRDGKNHLGYCDMCPCSGIDDDWAGNWDKEWVLVCGLPKSYSK